jgi:hypothetical protein
MRGESMRLELQAQLETKGYRHAVVLGPFGGRDGAEEYTVALYDPSGRVHRGSLRGTEAALRDEIAALPWQEPLPSRKR